MYSDEASDQPSFCLTVPSATCVSGIFWKPAVHWQVTKIEVLNPIKWTSVRRNEVGAVASKNPIFIEDKRQQKNTLCLKDVRYRIWAKLEFIPVRKRKGEQPSLFDETAHPDENPAKYNAMFERRASKGQCFNQPYLGTRECSCSFRLVNPEAEELDASISENRDLGIMLYDMDFEQNLKNPPAMFYRAQMENGVINVPPKDSEEILR